MDIPGDALSRNYTGLCLGNYRLLHLLGRGGSSEVYLAKHPGQNSLMSIKIPCNPYSEEVQSNFLQEAQTIALLRHPHIIHMHEYNVEQNVPYIVMDYAVYGSVYNYHSKQGILALETILRYARQVALALQFMHEQGFVHQDIKAENMLLAHPGYIWLNDFGMAVRPATAHQQMSRMGGTIAYIAPEQLRGEPCFASDQYALAVVIYKWLCGQLPFSGTRLEMMSHHLYDVPPSLHIKVPSLSPDVDNVIQKALSKNPQQRFSSIATFVDEFEHALLSKTMNRFMIVNPQQNFHRLQVMLDMPLAQQLQTISMRDTCRQKLNMKHILQDLSFLLAANLFLLTSGTLLCSWLTFCAFSLSLVVFRTRVISTLLTYTLTGMTFGFATGIGFALHSQLAWIITYSIICSFIIMLTFLCSIYRRIITNLDQKG